MLGRVPGSAFSPRNSDRRCARVQAFPFLFQRIAWQFAVAAAIPVAGVAQIALDPVQIAVDLARQFVSVDLHHGMGLFPVAGFRQFQRFEVIAGHRISLSGAG